MVKRLIVAIGLSPIWLLLAVIMAVLYGISYIKGEQEIIIDLPENNSNNMYADRDEFNVYAD